MLQYQWFGNSKTEDTCCGFKKCCKIFHCLYLQLGLSRLMALHRAQHLQQRLLLSSLLRSVLALERRLLVLAYQLGSWRLNRRVAHVVFSCVIRFRRTTPFYCQVFSHVTAVRISLLQNCVSRQLQFKTLKNHKECLSVFTRSAFQLVEWEKVNFWIHFRARSETAIFCNFVLGTSRNGRQ